MASQPPSNRTILGYKGVVETFNEVDSDIKLLSKHPQTTSAVSDGELRVLLEKVKSPISYGEIRNMPSLKGPVLRIDSIRLLVSKLREARSTAETEMKRLEELYPTIKRLADDM